jgi:N-acetylmuramoyl-L-alanine amidase
MPTLDEIKNKVIEVWESDHIILPSVTAAQFILESASGNSTLANATNNLFGIKASPPWSGDVYYHETNEEVNKSLLKVTDGFRKYATWQDSVQDHSDFFTSTETRKKVYAKVIGETEYTKVCNALTGTYATDSSYGKKLIAIIETNGLDAWDVIEEEIKVVKVYISPSSQHDNVGVGNYGTEETRMNQVADIVETELKRVGINTLRNNPSMDITQMVTASNNFGADVHLAIHSNAGGATGAEAYYYTGSAAGKKLAQAVYDNIAPMTPTADRGIKATTELYEVWATNGIATLVEIAFHDNATDAAFIINNIHELGIAIAKGVCSYLGIDFGTTTPQVTPQVVTVAPGTVLSSILYLPNGQMWTVYPEGSEYKTGQVISTEAAAPDSGLYLKVLGDKGNNILIVDLPDLGQMAIYYDKDKGATITQFLA